MKKILLALILSCCNVFGGFWNKYDEIVNKLEKNEIFQEFYSCNEAEEAIHLYKILCENIGDSSSAKRMFSLYLLKAKKEKGWDDEKFENIKEELENQINLN